MTTSSIPDDYTLEAALYGSAHIETVLARETGRTLAAGLECRIQDTLSGLDLELAEAILVEAPGLVMSDVPLHPQEWPPEVVETVDLLRRIVRDTLAFGLVRSWVEKAEHRGRLIGLGEHSARASVSGSSDKDYKTAVLRWLAP